jgi:hypothetical protein
MTEADLTEAYRIAGELTDATKYMDLAPNDDATGRLAQALHIFSGTLSEMPATRSETLEKLAHLARESRNLRPTR